jgi:hypothetical protein
MKQKLGGGGGGADFQDVGSQFWDLDFTQWASHDPGSTQLHSVRRSRALISANINSQDSPWLGLGETTTFPLIVFSLHDHKVNTHMSFCPETPMILGVNNFVC